MNANRTIVLIVVTVLAVAIWMYNIGSLQAVGVPSHMEPELATLTLHERDGRKFMEFKSGDLYYCYMIDNDTTWPSEPVLAIAYCLTQPNCSTPCAYKVPSWVVAQNKHCRTLPDGQCPDAPVYERVMVDGKRVKLKHPLTGEYMRAVIGMSCGGHSYYPSTSGTEFRNVDFIINGTRTRGMARCESRL